MAKIVKDEEISQLIAPDDSEMPSETDNSFEFSLESDGSVLEQTPKVWHSSSCESDESESESDSTSGGEGSGWQEVADGDHIQSQATFHYNEFMDLIKHFLKMHPPSVIFLYVFYSAASKQICKTN